MYVYMYIYIYIHYIYIYVYIHIYIHTHTHTQRHNLADRGLEIHLLERLETCKKFQRKLFFSFFVSNGRWFVILSCDIISDAATCSAFTKYLLTGNNIILK